MSGYIDLGEEHVILTVQTAPSDLGVYRALNTASTLP